MEDILVIDDDSAIRNLISEILTHSGYQVTVAQDGEEGIEFLKNNSHYKAIITDICMPIKDGNDVAKYVRNSFDEKSTPIVGISGSTEDAEDELFDLFFQKPFKIMDLRHAIDSL